jgi:hypothetical protein
MVTTKNGLQKGVRGDFWAGKWVYGQAIVGLGKRHLDLGEGKVSMFIG